MFKFSAGPRVWAMGVNFAWCWWKWFFVMNSEFQYVNERWWAYNLFNMACRDGPTLNLIPFQPIFTYGRRQFAPIMASNYFYFCLVFSSLLTRLSVMFNLPLSSRSCDDVDSESAKESSQKNYGAKLWGAQIFVHGDRILDFHKNWISVIEKLIHSADKVNLRCASGINIHRGPALRAIFKFSAEPRVWPMGCNFAWCWCMWFWMMNSEFEYVNLRWWAYT